MQVVSNQESSEMKPKRARGETIEMHVGRIVRSTGRKDRHSKVCTVRGPRDRRVRLSPHTAIQFYDVQDRLGYDRPSKALDWLMKEAKSTIDALDDSRTATNHDVTILMQQKNNLPPKGPVGQEERNYSKSAWEIDRDYLNDASMNNFSFFSMDNGDVPPSSTEFQTYPHGDVSTSRIKIQTHQDFSFLFSTGQQVSIPASTPVPHYATDSEIAICERILAWNSNSSNANESQESLINSLPQHFPSHVDQHQLFFHREPLQSSFSPPIRASLDNQFPNLSFSGNSFSTDDGLSELFATTRIQHQEEQNPSFGKPSSATSFLHYQNLMD